MTELEILEGIQKKMEASGTATAAEIKEIKSYIEAKKTEDAEFKALVDKLNKEAQEKDQKIGDLVNDVKELKAKKNRFQIPGVTEKMTIEQEMIEKIEEHKADIAASATGKLIQPIELKAAGVITTSSFTGTNAPYRNYLDWQPGMEPTGQFRFRSLVRTIQSDVDNVSFPRANSPVGQGSFGRQVLETDTKAQVDRGYAMIDVLCKVKAGFAIVGRRSLANIRFLQSWLPTSLMEQLEDTEDLDFANAVVGAATGSAATTGITSTGSTLVKTMVAIIKNQIQAKFNPGTICCDPNVWANMMLNVETNAGFNLPNVVIVDPQGNVRILGRVVQPVNWLTGNRVLCADWSKVAIVTSEGLTMRQSDSHDQIFAKNQLAFLLERVEEVAIFRPDAVTSTTIP